VLDGDLPKADWFAAKCSPPLSASDGQFHTVVAGRPIGLSPSMLRDLAAERIHLHFYGDVHHSDWRPWIEEAQRFASNQLHLHTHVGPERWVSEFSRYDAGWLHFLKSDNGGDLRRASWDDLNYPARLATLVSAGLPLIQYDNSGAVVATQSLSREFDIGVFANNAAELGRQLRDEARIEQIRANVWRAVVDLTGHGKVLVIDDEEIVRSAAVHSFLL